MSFEGRSAIVTGAGGGMGLTTERDRLRVRLLDHPADGSFRNLDEPRRDHDDHDLRVDADSDDPGVLRGFRGQQQLRARTQPARDDGGAESIPEFGTVVRGTMGQPTGRWNVDMPQSFAIVGYVIFQIISTFFRPLRPDRP